MLETREQKQIFAGCAVLVVVLIGVSFWQRSNFLYHDNVDYNALQMQSNQKQEQYNQYLASLGTSAQAQSAIVSQILPQAELQAEVEKTLNVSQKIVVPQIKDSQINISNQNGKPALQKYLSESGPIFDNLKTITDSGLDDIYNSSGDKNKINSMVTDVAAASVQYQKISVPKEAVTFHKQMIVALEAYEDLLKSSKSYMVDSSADAWPEMYKNNVIIGKSVAAAGTEFEQLNSKYNLLGDAETPAEGNVLVPKAQAQFAVVDIWAKAQEALEEAAATSIARFMLAFLDKLANKIEQVYKISNFLYYTDALVSGQYVDDYLNKYVDSSLDRTMIKNFIPEISCGNTKDYSKAFEAKANQYLGFDPASLSPSDPQYYQKMAKVGNYMSSPQGWQTYYQGVASEAQSAAQKAANNELLSPGQKAGRDALGNIISPVEVSVSSLRAIFQRYLSEGSDTTGFVGTQKITSEITQTFLNSFVLKGVVLSDQKTCISVPQSELVTQIQ